MLVLIQPQCGCVNVGGREVFGLVDGAWAPSSDGLHGAAENLTVSGTSVIEMRSIHRRADWFHFAPTGGTQTRTWAWDGAAGMAATPWVQQQPPQAPGVVVLLPRIHDPLNDVPPVTFFQVGNRIVCAVDDDHVGRARCNALWKRVGGERLLRTAPPGADLPDVRDAPVHACRDRRPPPRASSSAATSSTSAARASASSPRRPRTPPPATSGGSGPSTTTPDSRTSRNRGRETRHVRGRTLGPQGSAGTMVDRPRRCLASLG